MARQARGEDLPEVQIDLDVVVADGGRQATLLVAEARDGGGTALVPEDLCRALATHGVVSGLIPDVVARVVKALQTGARFRGQAIVAKEVPPQPPSREVRLDWLVAPGCLVLPDTLLCRFEPRAPGRDGCLVTGELVKAADLAPPAAVDGVSVAVGDGVVRAGGGLELRSLTFGWLNVAGLALSVSPAFVLEEGSAEFRGSIVRVAGDGRRVEAAHVRAALEALSGGDGVTDDTVQRILVSARDAPAPGEGASRDSGPPHDRVQGGPGGSGAGGCQAADIGPAEVLACVIDGDVDHRVGNVRCDGALTISGGVRPRFEVHAGSNLVIHGLIDAALVWSGGDVLVEGGIRGGGRGELRAAGTLTTRFIEQAFVEVQGDVLVESHIHQSNIFCDGKVVVRGVIAGGRVQALGGIEAGTLGNPEKSATILAPGTGFHCVREIERLHREMAQLQEQRGKLIGALQRLTGFRGLAFIAVLSPARREVALRLSQALLRLRGEIRKMDAALRGHHSTTREKSLPCVSATTEVYAGVIVLAHDRARSVTSTVPGPCRFQVGGLGEIVMV